MAEPKEKNLRSYQELIELKNNKAQNVCGIILAGGLSRRMNKKDKSKIKFNDMNLINFVFSRASKQVKNLIINSNNPELIKITKKKIFKDIFKGFLGPLSGVYTGLKWLQKDHRNIEWLMTFPVDSPFFPSDLVINLLNNLKEEMIVTASSDNRKHPVFSLWNVKITEDLESSLKKKNLKIESFTKKFKTKVVNFPIKDYDPFYNINYEQDLVKAKLIYKLFKSRNRIYK